tara:strand:- start:237 stop:521 length:285 start_codon:yes stop_codon:yes gene_type:complete
MTMSNEPRQNDVLIAEYVYRHEAEFGAGFLADAGIPFRVQADDAGGAYGGMTFTSAARIWVRSQDAEQAREILQVTPDPAIFVQVDDLDEQRSG